MKELNKLIIIILLCTIMFLSGYLLGLDNGLKDFSKDISNTISNVYKPINFEMRNSYWCSSNASQYRSIGMSMFPYSNTGINYYIDPVKFKQIEIGDIILYRINNSFVHHAVITKYDDRLYTAGFNNKVMDIEPVYADQIIGRDCIFKKP